MGNWSTTKTLTGHTGGVSSLAYGYVWPTFYFISGSLDQTIRVWNVLDGTTIKILTGHTGGVTSLFFYSFFSFQLNKPFNVLTSGSTDATIRFWDFEQGECN
jgi:COMPASS component SWD3